MLPIASDTIASILRLLCDAVAWRAHALMRFAPSLVSALHDDVTLSASTVMYSATRLPYAVMRFVLEASHCIVDQMSHFLLLSL